jgi:hypothetical protein
VEESRSKSVFLLIRHKISRLEPGLFLVGYRSRELVVALLITDVNNFENFPRTSGYYILYDSAKQNGDYDKKTGPGLESDQCLFLRKNQDQTKICCFSDQ